MADRRLTFRVGIDLESTATASRGGWNGGNLIRFRVPGGWVEKLGGWQKLTPTPLGGVCRALHFWSDLGGNRWLAAGTNLFLYVVNGTTVQAITPAGFPVGKVSSPPDPAFSLLVWSLDNFGQNLIAIASNRTLYAWDPTTYPAAAVAVGTAPAQIQGGFVTMQTQQIMAYGCTPVLGGTPDPMLLRWCDSGDYTTWVASTTNLAGSYRLPKGSRLVGGMQAPGATLLWTDFALYTASFIGYPLVWSFTEIGENCGLIAQNAAAIIGSVPYWMSDHGFFRLGGGGVEPIPCSVWDFVFTDIDTANQDKCFAALNYHFYEVAWYFPSWSGGTGEIDSYVKYNFVLNVWDCGRMTRTAWTDANRPGPPLAVDGVGLIQQHDEGVDADGAAMQGVFVQSGYQDISDGDEILLVNRLIPDFQWWPQGTNDQTVLLSVLYRQYPGDPETVAGPFPLTPTTEYATLTKLLPSGVPSTGIRAREVALKLECNAAATWFRLGIPRLRGQPDGKL